ncbi:MAG: hypothetical protein WKF94_10535 [Solirubrobacteraceae bacterium]
MRASPVIELLYFDGCPGHKRLLPLVQRLAEDAGAEIRLRRIETVEHAEAERFLGSPTVRIDGHDVDRDAAPRTDYGLKCRLYRVDGAQSQTPPEAWIKAALDRSP